MCGNKFDTYDFIYYLWILETPTITTNLCIITLRVINDA